MHLKMNPKRQSKEAPSMDKDREVVELYQSRKEDLQLMASDPSNSIRQGYAREIIRIAKRIMKEGGGNGTR